jgi:hypothetical protein
MTLLIILIALLVVLNLLDIHSTILVVGRLGLHSEKNPLARWVFRKLGLRPGIFLLKGLLLVIIPFLLAEFPQARTESLWALAAVDLLYLLVVGNNYRIWIRIRRRVRISQARQDFGPIT